MKRTMGVVACVALGFAGALTFSSLGSALAQPADVPVAKGEAKQPVDFEGKIVMIEVTRQSVLAEQGFTEVFKDARLATLGDRVFLVGKSYYPGVEESFHGSTVGVDWTTVSRFWLLSEEQFEAYKGSWDN